MSGPTQPQPFMYHSTVRLWAWPCSTNAVMLGNRVSLIVGLPCRAAAAALKGGQGVGAEGERAGANLRVVLPDAARGPAFVDADRGVAQLRQAGEPRVAGDGAVLRDQRVHDLGELRLVDVLVEGVPAAAAGEPQTAAAVG